MDFKIFKDITLETDRLILRNFEERDYLDFFEFLSDRETCYNDGGYEPFKVMDKNYFELMKKMKNDNRFVIELKSERKVIGTINILKLTNRVVESFEIGYVISPNYRKLGYGFESVSKVIDFLFENFNAKIITAGTTEMNISSLSLLKKLDFKFEGKITMGFKHPTYDILDLLYFIKIKK